MKQKWTEIVLKALPATTAQINATYTVKRMNATHRAEREKAGRWAYPVNSMVYATLVRLRRQGVVERGEDGIYRRTGK